MDELVAALLYHLEHEGEDVEINMEGGWRNLRDVIIPLTTAWAQLRAMAELDTDSTHSPSDFVAGRASMAKFVLETLNKADQAVKEN